MQPDDYPEWASTLAPMAAEARTVLILGDTDTGKTTFCTLLINAALAAGRSVAVVDADIGQSEVGPPACVGMGRPAAPVRSLVEVSPSALAFVGSNSPRGLLLEHAAATAAMAAAARETGPDLVVVDTTGFVRGAGARRLKQAKMQLIAPDHVVAIERRRECDAALAPLRFASHVAVTRLPVPAAIVRKSPAMRSQRRAAQFARYFQGSDLRLYSMDNVALTGTWMNSGTPLAPHLLKFLAGALGVRVFYAEECDRHLGIAAQAAPPPEQGITLIQEHFRTADITVTTASLLRHLLTGLADGNGKLLGVGLIESIDFRRRQIGILTPIRAPAAVRLIHFGLLRLRPDGTEVGYVRPGDV